MEYPEYCLRRALRLHEPARDGVPRGHDVGLERGAQAVVVHIVRARHGGERLHGGLLARTQGRERAPVRGLGRRGGAASLRATAAARGPRERDDHGDEDARH